MDEIYQEPTPEPIINGIVLTPLAAYDLKGAAKWAKFLAIVGFVFTGIIAVAACSLGAIFSKVNELNPVNPYGTMFSAMATFMTIIYLILAAVLFFIHLFLYQFASRTITAVEVSDSVLLERGLHRLQSYFKALGIIMIIELGLIALGLLFVVLGAAMAHH